MSAAQNSTHILGNPRISPDITSICFSNPSCSVPLGRCSVGSDSQSQTSGLNSSTTISEIPSDLYEFLVGDNGEAKILCKICQYTSNKKSNFKRHFTNMHFVNEDEGARMLECCGIRFTTKGEKFQHTKSVHKAGYKCSTCHKIFDRPALLQRHLAKHTGKKPYKCSLCTYQTPNKANAKRHIEKKHSDVQEGSIIFVTEDGEQIQMEIVSKSGKEQERFLSSIPVTIVKSTAVSTAFENSNEFNYPATSLCTVVGSPSATVTSSTCFPHTKGLEQGTLLDLAFGNTPKGVPVFSSKRRLINHSIDNILSKHSARQFAEISNRNISKLSDEPEISNYCSSHWSHASSLFHNPCVAHSLELHPYFHQHTCQGPYESNQGSLPLEFHQCAHGCWHIDNQNQTPVEWSSSPTFQCNVFVTDTNAIRSQDSRSLSSISQQTENSSTQNEDDDETEIIDVVGDEDETSGLPLSSLCEGLGSFSTREKRDCDDQQKEGESEMTFIVNPPVESLHSNRSSCRGSSGTSGSDKDDNADSEEYIPKKLRISRSFVK